MSYNPQLKRLLSIMRSISTSNILPWGSGTTWNPSDKGASVTLTNGNLSVYVPSGSGAARSTTSKSSGISVFEVTVSSLVGGVSIGVATSAAPIGTGDTTGFNAYSVGWYSATGDVYLNSSTLASPGTYTQGDVIGIVLNRDTNVLKFYKNGNLAATVSCSSLSGAIFATAYASGGSTVTANFGATAFAYSYS